METWVAVVTLVLLLSLAGIGGCAESVPKETPPAPPLTVDFSFPDGAPPLNQTAELICEVKNNYIAIRNMSVKVDLPEAFELVSGNLSWTGNISEGGEVEVIKAVVKAVKTGNWTIEVHKYVNPEEHGGFGGTGWHPVYVSIC